MMSRPPTGDRTSMARGSSSQACSGSPVVPPATEGWNPPRLRGGRGCGVELRPQCRPRSYGLGHGPQSPRPGTSAPARGQETQS